jgi:hypothetical protein
VGIADLLMKFHMLEMNITDGIKKGNKILLRSYSAKPLHSNRDVL